MAKVTFITTVFNEEKTIDFFINSLLEQSVMPSEIICVDACSTDSTALKISNFNVLNTKNKFPEIKIFKKNGNRSVGRNLAIQKATGDIIVCSDAGCILDKKWIENIIKPFENNNIDVVSGYYKPITKNVFQKSLATYTCVMEDTIDVNTFLPSSRSVAFKKTAWKKVGGYPEYLDTCEDLVFARNLKKHGYTFFFAKKAIVHWQQKENIGEAFSQFYNYAVGDGHARFIRFQTPFLFGRYGIGLLMLLSAIVLQSGQLGIIILACIVVYFLWAINKNYRHVQSWRAWYLLPILQIVSDFAVILGMTAGFMKSR